MKHKTHRARFALLTLFLVALLSAGALESATAYAQPLASSQETPITFKMGFLDFIFGKSRNSDSQLVEQSLPSNGYVFYRKLKDTSSGIVVTAPKNQSVYVKLKGISGNEALIFFVRAGQTAYVDAPAGKYTLYWASGKTWYGEKDLFGKSTTYSKSDTMDKYVSGYYWEYTLYGVSDGNMSSERISASEF